MKPEIIYWVAGVVGFVWLCRWAYRTGYNWNVPVNPSAFNAGPVLDGKGEREAFTNALTILTPEDCPRSEHQKQINRNLVALKREIEATICSNGKR